MPIPPTNIQIDTYVRLPKPHACGSNEWQITRVGADIGVRCVHCHRVVMIPRPQFERRAHLLVRPTDE